MTTGAPVGARCCSKPLASSVRRRLGAGDGLAQEGRQVVAEAGDGGLVAAATLAFAARPLVTPVALT